MSSQDFKSVTNWQGDCWWEVGVTVGGFSTVQAANDFGCHQAKRLIHLLNADYLVLIDSLGNHHKIEQNQVVVRKIKSESQHKLCVGDDDFAIADVKIEDFSTIEGLNTSFECLSYGVAL